MKAFFKLSLCVFALSVAGSAFGQQETRHPDSKFISHRRDPKLNFMKPVPQQQPQQKTTTTKAVRTEKPVAVAPKHSTF